jgi:hypothetical protein
MELCRGLVFKCILGPANKLKLPPGTSYHKGALFMVHGTRPSPRTEKRATHATGDSLWQIRGIESPSLGKNEGVWRKVDCRSRTIYKLE